MDQEHDFMFATTPALVKKLEAEKTSMKKELEELKKQNEMHLKQNNVLQGVILVKHSAIQSLTSRLETLQDDKATTVLEQDLGDVEKLQALQEKLEDKEQVIANLSSRLGRVIIERRAAEREVQERREQEDAFYRQNQELVAECGIKRAQCEHLLKGSKCLRDCLAEHRARCQQLEKQLKELGIAHSAKSTAMADKEKSAAAGEDKEVYEDSLEWPGKPLQPHLIDLFD